MNSFLPSRLKKEQIKNNWEENQFCYAAPINRPCSNSPLNPSDFFCSLLYSVWLTLTDCLCPNPEKLNQTPTKEAQGFSFSYLSHVWFVSKAGKQPQHPKVNHRYQSKPVHHHWYDDQTVECHRPHTHTAHTHTAPAVRQLRKKCVQLIESRVGTGVKYANIVLIWV